MVEPVTGTILAAAAANALGGAALGAVVAELLKSILDVKDKVGSFRFELERLEYTIEMLKPRIDMIDQSEENTELMQEELVFLKSSLKEGSQIVEDCVNLRKRDVIKKLNYLMVLRQLDNSLMRFFHLNAQAQNWCKLLKISAEAKNNHSLVEATAKNLAVQSERVEESLVCLKASVRDLASLSERVEESLVFVKASGRDLAWLSERVEENLKLAEKNGKRLKWLAWGLAAVAAGIGIALCVVLRVATYTPDEQTCMLNG